MYPWSYAWYQMLHDATHFCVLEKGEIGKTKTSPALALLNVDSMDSIYDFCRCLSRQVGVSHARLLFAVGSHSPGLWSCLDAENVSSLESGRVRVLRLLWYIPQMENDKLLSNGGFNGKIIYNGDFPWYMYMNTLIIILLLTKKSMTSGWWKGGKTLGFA